jgi:hypothetical protein
VFRLGGAFWMLAESRDGLVAYRSPDARAWAPAGRVLAHSGTRPFDAGPARSPDVVALDDRRAIVIYYVQTGSDSFGAQVPTSGQASVAQVAELRLDGESLEGDRDRAFELALPRPLATTA